MKFLSKVNAYFVSSIFIIAKLVQSVKLHSIPEPLKDTLILGTLKGTDYEQIIGISVEEFIKILKSSKKDK